MVKNTDPRFVSPMAWNRIEQWSRRKPAFALMGEFSAGKSTLMNFLLREQALPTQVTATQLPPVWFSWGSSPAYVKRHDGSKQSITLDELETIAVNDAQFVRIFLKADILEAVDLIDTPGISDPKISTDVWQRAVGQANGVLWCTHSTQAWRETERATWVSLPERLQNNSLLLITRADALSAKDRQKVLRRVNREAGHLFNRTILFSARDAITARDKTGDAELWSRSGGGKMVDSFLEITEQIMDGRADQLARYQIDKSQSGQTLVHPAEEADSIPEDSQVKLVELSGGFKSEDRNVITNFPVRPARVERRTEEPERSRIDPNEAERMRAEMVNDVEATSKEELRSYFRETTEDSPHLSGLTNPDLDVDEFEFSEGDEVNEEPELIIVSQEEEDSLTSEVEPKPGPDIGQSVSSITALLAEQTKGDGEDYEPEPEGNVLTAAEVVSIEPDTPMSREDMSDQTDPTSEHLLDARVSAPPSALSMWREIEENDPLPDDAKGLKNAFTAFLREFDQIALEHNAHGQKNPLRSVRKSNDNAGAEWHVL